VKVVSKEEIITVFGTEKLNALEQTVAACNCWHKFLPHILLTYLLTYQKYQHEWSEILTVNRIKNFWLLWPTQLLTHGQWWSIFRIQRWHMLQRQHTTTHVLLSCRCPNKNLHSLIPGDYGRVENQKSVQFRFLNCPVTYL